MLVVSKITARYDAVEDRIALSAQDAHEARCQFWLTQKLANRFVLTIAQWLEENAQDTGSGGTNTVNAFEQAAAQAMHLPSEAIPPAPLAETTLLASIDIARAADQYRMVFASRDAKQATLTLNELELRQFLHIIGTQFVTAQWDFAAWPVWLSPNAATLDTPEPRETLH